MLDDFHKQPTLPGPEAEKARKESIEIPDFIGLYKIESLLEIGGMSMVYLGTHPDTHDPVTIKTLLPKFLSNPEIVERFLNEGEIIAKADHPNVVKLYGQGKWEGGLYIAMEFIEGVSLRQYLQHNPISLKRSLEIILEVAYALCHLHSHGIIHRDLKLENILITKSGNVKVIDFGIAQLFSPKKNSPTFLPRIIGTPVYMSPEQQQDPDSVSYPSDIYSLGIIAYELILGKLSHGRVHLALMPKGVQKILSKALQPKAEDRYQDVVDFITAISAYMNSTTLEQEKSENRLSVFAESIQQAQKSLLPHEVPQWDKLSIGIASEKGNKVSGIYYDFLQFPDKNFGIVIAETTQKGAEGVVYTGILHGIMRSLAQTTSDITIIADRLNALLIEDPIQQTFPFCLLYLSPDTNLFSYLSCGFGTAWHLKQENFEKIATENPPIGMEKNAVFQKQTINSWEPGDTLIFSSSLGGEKLFQTIQEIKTLPTQKKAESILRKMKLQKSEEEQSMLILVITRD